MGHQNANRCYRKAWVSGGDRIFMEKMSGTKANRPELNRLRQAMRAGDVVVCTRIDRLGRSAKDLLSIVSELQEKGVMHEILDHNIDTATVEGRLFFALVAAFAEFEHAIMVARTKDGLAAARAEREGHCCAIQCDSPNGLQGTSLEALEVTAR